MPAGAGDTAMQVVTTLHKCKRKLSRTVRGLFYSNHGERIDCEVLQTFSKLFHNIFVQKNCSFHTIVYKYNAR